MALLAWIARVGAGAFGRFAPPEVVPGVDLDPRHLPYYAGRSTLRMFVALGCSLLFTLTYGYIAAKSRRAERLLIPVLDTLQSVPVLGFLSITVTGFMALFPGSLLGLEAASIFAIFTSQAWNMTFSFYQSLRTPPRELDEAVTVYRLPSWQRFSRLEVPAATIGLVWNAMMSFGGDWFFVAASEAISVLNQKFTLPGIGSYVVMAVQAQNLRGFGLAVLTMAVVIVAVDQCFWRPLIAWADKFRLEQSAAAEAPRSWLLELLRAARIPRLLGNALAPLGEVVNRGLSGLTPVHPVRPVNPRWQRWSERIYTGLLLVLVAGFFVVGVEFILGEVGLGEVGTTAMLGLATFGRVLIVVIVGTLVWTPVGVMIGFHLRLASLLQPVVQFLAAFPANFLFPFATLFFIHTGISLNWGRILLMSLGAQWYILFNTIAGAMSIPSDLREMAANMAVHGWRLRRTLIIPGVFSAWVTGGVTASGGGKGMMMTTSARDVLIAAERVAKTFPLPKDKGVFTVLRDVSLTVQVGGVLALLGRSGSGKSTLLRMLAGLIPATTGRIVSRGVPLNGPNPDVAMVFQSFALLPWLTVQQNVELGLEARGIDRSERQRCALKAIDLVGLGGFESAYPKELSGGMKQRLGFARAFVVEPRVLFMDEPFSTLDVLTAENLRGEIGDLWDAGKFPAQSILIVTHSIEGAVLLADRVLILGANPGRIRGEVAIDLPRPHDRASARFKALVNYVYTVMTHPDAEVLPGPAGATRTGTTPAPGRSPYVRPLPHARAGGISGLLELIMERPEAQEDLPHLAARLQLQVDDLLPILDAATLLDFAAVARGDVLVTPSGRAFAEADILTSKVLFRRAALARAPSIASIYQTLRAKRDGSMRVDFFQDLLDEHYPRQEAERQLMTAVDWGRYAELFEYDASEARLYLPEHAAGVGDESV